MTGGQDDAAEQIDTSDAPEWPKARIEWQELGRLRLCRELLEAAVKAWETSSELQSFGARYVFLTDVWHAKAKEAIGE